MPDPSADRATSPYAPRESWALLVLLALVTVALGSILLPFFAAIVWGLILSLLFTPMHRWLLPRLGRKPTLAALCTMAIILLIVILPMMLVLLLLAQEATWLYQGIQSGDINPSLYFHRAFNRLPDWVGAILDRFGLVNFSALQRKLSAALAQGSEVAATQVFNIGQNAFDFVVGLMIALYLAFFLIRDGDTTVRAIGRMIPLAPAHRQQLWHKFATVVRATVRGNLVVALIQGALGGLAFWALGVKGALLWAILMAALSLLPAVGAALVWGPVALYFLMTGAIWQGLTLTAYGVLVIGLVDNLLRPVLVGKDTRMPDYVVMITTIGGMAVFGINGFVLGPLIAAMFIAAWQIFGTTR
ncbi:MAG: AI-2E family transporter [Comamonadaceae bacterium CG_4_9_14_3_um_filter_60_33]|nr:MAG: AI-2E family transporter [Comamonadaceae bacterium CG_4_10_14_3_um_filter_60_42]PJB46429.1 MAG: AI-2E family transporter [Comamonadaceae bacterium CG_4_9_14_3_um_filter_60_33]